VDPLKIYDYLTKARHRVLDAVGALTPQQYQHEFIFGLKTIGATLTHIMVSEWYYIERLEERTVPPYDQWPIKYESPPAFDVIEATWREQAKRVRAVIAAHCEAVIPAQAGIQRESTGVLDARLRGHDEETNRSWNRKITWLSFPDDTRGNKRFHITATAGDMFTQLALHEVHHRAQIMAMLREMGKPLEDLDYNALMYERVEAS
jgi:uncharacterized damage-inducible protein DinB